MSAKFPEYKGLDLPKVAEEILHYWEENNIFEKSVSYLEKKQPFVFLKGPLLQTDCQVFTMFWHERLKIFFLVTKP